MKTIGVGSTNRVKVEAVKDIVPLYELLTGAEVFPIDAPSDVSEQPKSLDETVRGAMNRARGAQHGHDLGFGIEGGLAEVPHTKTGMMNVCVCAIYDGVNFHIGLSSGFECPPAVIELVKKENVDINHAFKSLGLTDNPKLGSHEGVVGILTHGRLDRQGYIRQAIVTAMIHLENSDLYVGSNTAV